MMQVKNKVNHKCMTTMSYSFMIISKNRPEIIKSEEGRNTFKSLIHLSIKLSCFLMLLKVEWFQ